METCRDLMTADLTTASPSSTLQQVAAMMADADTGIIPIVDGDRLVGAVTDRDIAVRAVAKGHGPDTEARAIMTTELATVAPGDRVDEAVRLMGARQIRRIFVCEGGTLQGIIAQADVARKVSEQKTGHLVEQISEG